MSEMIPCMNPQHCGVRSHLAGSDALAQCQRRGLSGRVGAATGVESATVQAPALTLRNSSEVELSYDGNSFSGSTGFRDDSDSFPQNELTPEEAEGILSDMGNQFYQDEKTGYVYGRFFRPMIGGFADELVYEANRKAIEAEFDEWAKVSPGRPRPTVEGDHLLVPVADENGDLTEYVGPLLTLHRLEEEGHAVYSDYIYAELENEAHARAAEDGLSDFEDEEKMQIAEALGHEGDFDQEDFLLELYDRFGSDGSLDEDAIRELLSEGR